MIEINLNKIVKSYGFNKILGELSLEVKTGEIITFVGENVFKKIQKLSGGEKVRLKLFELIQCNHNCLILDEPTNHIDISTKELLEEALKDYQVTVIYISHDIYFINKLANKILYIENKQIKEYLGNYDYLREHI